MSQPNKTQTAPVEFFKKTLTSPSIGFIKCQTQRLPFYSHTAHALKGGFQDEPQE